MSIVTDKQRLAIPLLLVLLVLFPYAQTLGFGWLSYDDPQYVTENPHIAQGLTWDGLREAFTHGLNLLWIPVTSISYMAGVSLHGLHPSGHHATNVLLHAINVLLAFAVFRRLCGSLPAATLIAALVATHPLHVEPVAWVSGRKDLLCALFWLLCLGAYLRYSERPSPAKLTVVVLLFALGMASKVTMMTLPFVLLVLDWQPLRRVWEWKRLPHCVGLLVLEKLPMMLVAALAAWWAVQLHVNEGGIRDFDAVPLGVRLMNATHVYALHLRQVVAPYGLTIHYPYAENGPALPVFAASLSLLVVVTFACVALARRLPLLLVGWLWYLIALAPSVGLARVDSFLTADRYTYVPMLGVYLMLGVLFDVLLQQRPALRRPAVALVTLLVLALAGAAFVQAQTWRDDLSLFGRAVSVHPDSPTALNGYGTALSRAGRIEEAKAVLEKARAAEGPFRILPTMNLAMLAAKEANWTGARTLLGEVVSGNPSYAPAYGALAQVLQDEAKTIAAPEARAALEAEARIAQRQAELTGKAAVFQPGQPDPDGSEALCRIGLAYQQLSRIPDAMEHYARAALLDPANPKPHSLRGTAHFSQQRLNEARAAFEEALRIDPGFAPAQENLKLLQQIAAQ